MLILFETDRYFYISLYYKLKINVILNYNEKVSIYT